MSVTTIESGALRELLRSTTPPHLVDVRTPGESESIRISGSHNLPLDLLLEYRRELTECVDRQVVLVCRSGQRAMQARDALHGAGLVDVGVLDGGITAWDSGSHDLVRGVPRWELERQVRLVAGTLVLSGVLGSLAVPRLSWLAGAVGAGLAGAALTNTCAMGMALARLPYNRGPSVDVHAVMADLAGRSPGRVAVR